MIQYYIFLGAEYQKIVELICINNRGRSYTQFDSRKQVIALLDRLIACQERKSTPFKQVK